MRACVRNLPVVLLGLALVAGCGKPKGTLSGRVTLNGDPLPAGQVTAYGPDNHILGISEISDGSYTFSDLPPGPVTLTVTTHYPDGRPLGDQRPPPREGEKLQPLAPEKQQELDKYKPVPLKYAYLGKSELKATVAKGNTSYDIEMTGKGEIPKPPPIKPSGGGPITAPPK